MTRILVCFSESICRCDSETLLSQAQRVLQVIACEHSKDSQTFCAITVSVDSTQPKIWLDLKSLVSNTPNVATYRRTMSENILVQP